MQAKKAVKLREDPGLLLQFFPLLFPPSSSTSKTVISLYSLMEELAQAEKGIK